MPTQLSVVQTNEKAGEENRERMKSKQGENENSNQIRTLPTMKYDRYQKFRQQTYQMLGKAKDTTFELMDSVMTTRNASCLGEFSLSPLFRRKWLKT